MDRYPNDRGNSELYNFSHIDKGNEFEEDLKRCYYEIEALLKYHDAGQMQAELQNLASRSRDWHNKVIRGLLYSILINPGNCDQVFENLSLVKTDSYEELCESLNNLIKPPFLKFMKRDIAHQIMWVISQLCSKNINKVDGALINFLSEISIGPISEVKTQIRELLVNMLLLSQEWLLRQPRIFIPACYIFLRMAKIDKDNPTLQALEITLCNTIIINRFDDVCKLGRDFIRALIEVSNLDGFKEIWYRILHDPKSLSAKFEGGVVSILRKQTPRKHIVHSINNEIRRDIEFMLEEVDMKNYSFYKDFFYETFIKPKGGEYLIPDIIRYICACIHPTNAILASTIVQRYQFIEDLLGFIKDDLIAAEAKLALFLDWLFYDPAVDNIMDIEPAILLIANSLDNKVNISETLIEFLDLLLLEFLPDKEIQKEMRRNVGFAMDHILRCGVIQSILPIYENNRIDYGIKFRLYQMFPNNLKVQPPEFPNSFPFINNPITNFPSQLQQQAQPPQLNDPYYQVSQNEFQYNQENEIITGANDLNFNGPQMGDLNVDYYDPNYPYPLAGDAINPNMIAITNNENIMKVNFSSPETSPKHETLENVKDKTQVSQKSPDYNPTLNTVNYSNNQQLFTNPNNELSYVNHSVVENKLQNNEQKNYDTNLGIITDPNLKNPNFEPYLNVDKQNDNFQLSKDSSFVQPEMEVIGEDQIEEEEIKEGEEMESEDDDEIAEEFWAFKDDLVELKELVSENSIESRASFYDILESAVQSDHPAENLSEPLLKAIAKFSNYNVKDDYLALSWIRLLTFDYNFSSMDAKVQKQYEASSSSSQLIYPYLNLLTRVWDAYFKNTQKGFGDIKSFFNEDNQSKNRSVCELMLKMSLKNSNISWSWMIFSLKSYFLQNKTTNSQSFKPLNNEYSDSHPFLAYYQFILLKANHYQLDAKHLILEDLKALFKININLFFSIVPAIIKFLPEFTRDNLEFIKFVVELNNFKLFEDIKQLICNDVIKLISPEYSEELIVVSREWGIEFHINVLKLIVQQVSGKVELTCKVFDLYFTNTDSNLSSEDENDQKVFEIVKQMMMQCPPEVVILEKLFMTSYSVINIAGFESFIIQLLSYYSNNYKQAFENNLLAHIVILIKEGDNIPEETLASNLETLSLDIHPKQLLHGLSTHQVLSILIVQWIDILHSFCIVDLNARHYLGAKELLENKTFIKDMQILIQKHKIDTSKFPLFINS